MALAASSARSTWTTYWKRKATSVRSLPRPCVARLSFRQRTIGRSYAKPVTAMGHSSSLTRFRTVWGRTGRMFTCEHYDVVPDILVIGKGLGGGIFPLAALVAREDLDVAPERALGHYTHEKNPVACAAALATIEVIEEEHLLENARDLGAHALGRMQAMKQKHAIIGDIRGLGLLMGMELVEDGKNRERTTDLAEEVMYKALARGLSFKLTMGNILTLTPPPDADRGRDGSSDGYPRHLPDGSGDRDRRVESAARAETIPDPDSRPAGHRQSGRESDRRRPANEPPTGRAWCPSD